MKKLFRTIANRVSTWAGSASAFLGAALVIVVWASTGSFFEYSDTWQLVINTGTTIVTFLMVFLIQNTQNRDGKAVQIKLDELLRATKGARQWYAGLEEMTDDEIAQLNAEFQEFAHRPGAARALQRLHDAIEAEHEHRRGIHLPGRK